MHTINGRVNPELVSWQRVSSNWNFTDDGGAQGTYTIFTVSGDIYLFGIFGVCQVSLDSLGAPTIELGIAGNTAALIAQTTALNLDINETWQDATPTVNPAPVILLVRSFVVANGADIILTVGTADLTAGDIDFHCFWAPLSSDGAIVGV